MINKKRRFWIIKPVQKPHSTKKGKVGYNRQKNKEILRKESNRYD